MLSFPESEGGINLPDVGLMNRGIALRTTLRILRDTADSPTKVLLNIWWDRYQQGHRAAPHRFHAVVRAYYQKISSLLPAALDLSCPSPAVMAKVVLQDSAATADSLRRRVDYASGVSWTSFACPWLPGHLRDIVWSFAWQILPTRDRLHVWNVTSTEACPYCGRRETNQHVLFECRISRLFWILVRRSTNILCPVRFNQRRPNRLSVLVTACGSAVLWKARCKAVAQRQRNTPIFLLVRQLRVAVTNHLQRELFAFGDGDFLRRWQFHPSILVQAGCVSVHGVPP